MGAFRSADCESCMPREPRAMRSVAMWRLDTLIYDNDPNAIKHELIVNNPWRKVQDILKVQKGQGIKNTSHVL